MTAPVAPSAEVAWHEARTEAAHTSRALGNTLIAATLLFGLSVAWVAGGWAWVVGYALLWTSCALGVRRWGVR